MQTFEFSPEEIEMLQDVLRRGIDEVNVEMFHTDTHDFKMMLKHRKEVMEHVLQKVSALSMAA